MNKQGWLLLVLVALVRITATAQPSDSTRLGLMLPAHVGWNVVREGEKLEFRLAATGDSSTRRIFNLPSEAMPGVRFDSVGTFSWIPPYDFVDRLQDNRTVQLVFEVRNERGETARQSVDIQVLPVNQAPVVGELKTLYAQYNAVNTYQIGAEAVKDPDNDPVVFIALGEQMPEGAKLSGTGEFTWKPSLGQFNQLKTKPITLEFLVEDQPGKAQTRGKFRIDATQMDLPPLITAVPALDQIRCNEGTTLHLGFYLSDPNGDDNIRSFDFVSQDARVPKPALRQNTPTQYEFIWQPGYTFVDESRDSLVFDLTFFVIDKTNKREEKRVRVTVLDQENEQEKDRQLYQKYRAALASAADLLEQLRDKEKELKKEWKDAKKGKKHRSIVNASLGAVTGISPAFLEGNPQKVVSSVGGTTVLTMGTLEATNVIGRSQGEIVEKLNAVVEKKNELQTKGDAFARKYTLGSTRRNPAFSNEQQDFLGLMSLKATLALELDASTKDNRNHGDSQISRFFKDFIPFSE